MNKVLNVLCSGDDGHGGTQLMFMCPGCGCFHAVNIGTGPGPRWTYNNDPEKPTFSPSILVTGVQPMTDEQHAAWRRGEGLPEPRPLRCHSFVTDGRIKFLSDCTHALAGQTVDLPPWEE